MHLSTCGATEGDEVGNEEKREEDVRAAVGASVLAHHALGLIVVACASHLCRGAALQASCPCGRLVFVLLLSLSQAGLVLGG